MNPHKKTHIVLIHDYILYTAYTTYINTYLYSSFQRMLSFGAAERSCEPKLNYFYVTCMYELVLTSK